MHRLVERPSIALAHRLGALADQGAGAMRPACQRA
jgi:hypothetical protein